MTMAKFKSFLPYLIIILAGIWGIAGLWKIPGLPTSHDSISHMARMYAYAEGLRDHVFPVLWARRMFWGIGSPVLMLNYQIPYYFAMLWHYLGLSLVDSFKMVLSVSQIASGILMYLAMRNRFKRIPSLVVAILYMTGPYRFLNIYVRGAMGEVFATMFPPIILAGIWRKSRVLQTIGWTGLFLSHPVGSALYSGILLGYVLFTNKLKDVFNTLKDFFVPYLLAFLIAAFNLLPTLALTKYTYYRTENSDTLHHFPTLSQLMYSTWGYGFSTDDGNDQMSFQIGVMQWALLGFGSLYGAHLIRKHKDYSEVGYLVLAFVLSILLMLKPIATPIYVHLGLAKIIDYPWRILMVFGFISSILGAIMITATKNYLWRGLLICFLVAGAFYTNRNHVRINLVWPWPSDSFRHGTGDAYGEYAAKYRATRDGSEFYELSEYIEGTGRIAVVSDKSNLTKIVVESSNPSQVRFNMMYFPGWHVRIDDKEVKINTAQNPESQRDTCYVTNRISKHIDDSGLVACHFLPGKHSAEMKYEPLPVQKIGNLLSCLGIGILIWLMSQSFYQHTMNRKQS